jgi:hypothetical protein
LLLLYLLPLFVFAVILRAAKDPADPLLELRAALHLISGRRRRSA